MNQGRTKARYARCTSGVDQNVRLEESECEHVMRPEKGATAYDFEISMDYAQIVHVM